MSVVSSGDYDLLESSKHPKVEFYNEGNVVYMSFHGDGLYLFEVESNRNNTFAEQICHILNKIPKSKVKK